MASIVLTAIYPLIQESLLYTDTCECINTDLSALSDEVTDANSGALIKIASSFKTLLEKLKAQPEHRNFILHARNLKELETLADAMIELCREIRPEREQLTRWHGRASDWKEHELAGIKQISDGTVTLALTPGQSREEALLELQYELTRQRLEPPVLEMIRQLVDQRSLSLPLNVPKWFVPVYDVVQGGELKMFGVGSLHRQVITIDKEQVVIESLHEETPGELDESSRNKFKKDMDDCYSLEHPNLACVKGANHVASPPFIVYGCDTYENALEYLVRTNPPRATVWQLLYEAACGLEHIHKEKLVHGHLWLRSILVDTHGHARVGSFGLVETSVEYRPRHLSQTFRWKTCDAMDGEAPSAESDVYALAMCMIEAVTRSKPFAHLRDSDVIKKLKEHEIPRRPKDMTENEWSLVKAMTTDAPRYSITQAKDGLRKLHEESTPQGEEEEDVSVATNIPNLLARLESNTNATDALQALYRHVQDEKSHQDMEESGYDALTKAVESTESSAMAKLYAFAILDRRQRRWEPSASAAMSGLKRFLVDENQHSLGSQKTLNAWVARLASDQEADRLEACELLSCFAVSFSYLPSSVIDPLCGFLKAETSDPTLKAAAAEALGYFAFTSLDLNTLELIEQSGAFESLVAMVRSGANVEKVNALWALCSLTGDHQARKSERVVQVCLDDSSSDFVHEIFEDEEVIASLVAYVVSEEHDATDTTLALRLLGNIATSNPIRNCIIQQGALESLAKFLRENDREKTHKNEHLKTTAADVVCRLSEPSQLAVQIARDLPLKLLIDLLAAKSGVYRRWVVMSLFSLARDASVRAGMGDAITHLVSCLQSSDATLRLYSAATLSTLAFDDALCTRMGREGVIDALTSTVSSLSLSEETIKTYALSTIVIVARSTLWNTQCMVQAVAPLADRVHLGRDDSASRDAVLETISRIGTDVSGLSKDTVDCVIDILSIAYHVGTGEQKRWASLGLGNLATTESVHESIFRKHTDLIPSLMAIVRDDIAGTFHASALRGLVRVAKRTPLAVVESVGSTDDIVALKNMVKGVKGEQRALAAELLYHLTTEEPTLKIMVVELVGNELKQLNEKGNDEEKVWAAKALANLQ